MVLARLLFPDPVFPSRTILFVQESGEKLNIEINKGLNNKNVSAAKRFRFVTAPQFGRWDGCTFVLLMILFIDVPFYLHPLKN